MKRFSLWPEKDSPLERDIESRAVAEAKRRGWLAWKMTWTVGLPDRLFLRMGCYVWIEFKKPGKKPTKRQQKIIDLLLRHGAIVHVCDDVDVALGCLDAAFSGRNWYPGAEDL